MCIYTSQTDTLILYCTLYIMLYDNVYIQAVGVVLLIIAVKLGAEVAGIELLTPLQSLIVVLSTLGTGVAASLIKQRQDEQEGL